MPPMFTGSILATVQRLEPAETEARGPLMSLAGRPQPLGPIAVPEPFLSRTVALPTGD